jgi:DNA polymerase III alpha subunit (gram-positive type)
MKRQLYFDYISGEFKKAKHDKVFATAASTEASVDETKNTALPEEKVTEPEPFFLFFDVETDGQGSFRRPFSQTVVQVSWTVTDRKNNVLDSYTSFVKGASVLKYNPNNWTVEQVNAGEEPATVASLFTEVATRVIQNKGYLVAHNIEFDLDAMKSIGAPVNKFSRKFCTKVHTTSICRLPGGRPYKWPSQQQLHDFLFPKNNTVQQHDAQDDVSMLRQNFFECVSRAGRGFKPYKPFLL